MVSGGFREERPLGGEWAQLPCQVLYLRWPCSMDRAFCMGVVSGEQQRQIRRGWKSTQLVMGTVPLPISSMCFCVLI